MSRVAWFVLTILGLSSVFPLAADEGNAVKAITIRAPRDMGYFAGDLVKADIDIIVDDDYTIEEPSLPHPGPISYWLDLRKIDIAFHRYGSGTRCYSLHLLYQNFYDALDARPQEIPTFPVTFSKGGITVSANVPAWTIGVSSLREIAPPIKNDPKDYLRADDRAIFIDTDPVWWSVAVAAFATCLAFAVLAHDRAWGPFRRRPARVFNAAVRTLRDLARRPDNREAYLDALLILHRGIDHTDGRRVLADDLAVFLDRHPVFKPLYYGFARFFAASRNVFFGSDPERARADFDFHKVQSFARQLAIVERTKP